MSFVQANLQEKHEYNGNNELEENGWISRHVNNQGWHLEVANSQNASENLNLTVDFPDSGKVLPIQRVYQWAQVFKLQTHTGLCLTSCLQTFYKYSKYIFVKSVASKKQLHVSIQICELNF